MNSNDALKDELYNKFHTASQDIFHLTGHKWQADIGVKILEAVELKKSIKVLCGRPTGGGKSLIFNVVATVLKGVTICICPLLSLGADQTRKTLDAVGLQSPARVTSFFHLDELKLKSVFHLIVNLEMNGRREALSSSALPLKHSTVERVMLYLPSLSATS